MGWLHLFLRKLSSSSSTTSTLKLQPPVSSCRLLPPDLSTTQKVRKSVCFTFSTKAARFDDPLQPVLQLHQQQQQQQSPSPSSHIITKPNAQLLFSRMTSLELFKTLLNLQVMSCGPLVDLGIKLLKSPLASHKLLSQPVLWCVKRTVYSQFCAGEDAAEASKTLQRMWEMRLRGILDYGLEDAEDNSSCDENIRHILATVESINSIPRESVSFACVKITAIAPLALLERITHLLKWELADPVSNTLPWKLNVLPVLSPQSPASHAHEKKPEPLTAEEQSDLKLAQERLHRLCEACEKVNRPLLVDAEYSTVQPAIDYITYVAADRFNREQQRPLIYATVQAYLRDSYSRLELLVREAARRQVPFGVKLVRGAYLSRETALAKSRGVPSPVHSSIEETHRCYDKCAAFLLQQVSEGRGAVVLATHNFNSGKAAAQKVEELGMKRDDLSVHFAQLKGMADGLSLSLVEADFQVSKYLPFGPVGNVLKYLIRRAEENRGLLRGSKDDRVWIRRELMRRWFGVSI